ncbi:VWA domain-containing protein [Haloglycomyces albus]|uniref:VWA domain-containing protein n=1 Tax=Haloglycomyces albus TaxID=526067 RepID=UPI00046C99E5|nr:substrate-binding domain-containing protein [Haloglycomyces albus]
MIFEDRTVKSHRGGGRRRRRTSRRLPVAPWMVMVAVAVITMSAVTVVFVNAVRSGCDGSTYRVPVAAANSIVPVLEEQARNWEETSPDYEGSCIGVEVNRVASGDAAAGLSGDWNERNFGSRPAAWVPDSSAWIDWIADSGSVEDISAADPVIIGSSHLVVAASEASLEEHPWLAGANWDEIVARSAAGDISVAAAEPRRSSAGLQALLNVALNDTGEIERESVTAWSDALDNGRTAVTTGKLFGQVTDIIAEEGDPETFADAYVAFDYEVESFNQGANEFQLETVEPQESLPDPIYPYLVLESAGWVNDIDAEVASQFGEYLEQNLEGTARSATEAPEVSTRSNDGVIRGETVRSAVQEWYLQRRQANVLAVMDRSEHMGLTDANGLTNVDLASEDLRELTGQLQDSSQMGLWSFTDDVSGEYQQALVQPKTLGQDDQRGSIDTAISNILPGSGGSPLYAVIDSSLSYMEERQVEEATDSILIFTAATGDPVSPLSQDDLLNRIAESDSTLRVNIVGYGGADGELLSEIAQATGGGYVDATDGVNGEDLLALVLGV